MKITSMAEALVSAAREPVPLDRANAAKAELVAMINGALAAPADRPKAKPKRPRLTRDGQPNVPLARQIDAVTDATLAFLLSDLPEGTSRSVAQWRTEFANWCAARPEFADWRKAWARFAADITQPANVVEVQFAPLADPETVEVRPAVSQVPAWVQQRLTKPGQGQPKENQET